MDQLKLSFDELVKMHTRNIHSALLESGGKGMETMVHNAMSWAIQWNIERTKLENPLDVYEAQVPRKG